MCDEVCGLLWGWVKMGWHQSGFFFLQLCIGLLLFSSVVEKVRARIVAPAREAIQHRDARIKGLWSAYCETPREVRMIFFGFSVDSSAALKLFDESVENHLKVAERRCWGWLIFALLLHLSGWPYWMGGATLIVTWPIISLYCKVAKAQKKALASIAEYETGLMYCAEYLEKYCGSSITEPESALDNFISEC